MTRRIALIVILVFLVTLGTYEIIAVNMFLDHMEKAVDQLQTEITLHQDDLTVLVEYVNQEKAYWEKREKNLNLMFNHKDLKNVCDTMNRVQTYIAQNDYENALVEMNVLVETVHELRSVMCFNYDNIL